MNNYLFTDKTVAVFKKNNETIIYNIDEKVVINKNIKSILEFNCNYYGSNLKGRLKSAKNILNIKYKIPILIENNLILIQLNSIRKEECLFLVVNKIIDYQQENDYLNILCINNISFKVKISKNYLDKQIINAIKLYNILNYRKNFNNKKNDAVITPF